MPAMPEEERYIHGLLRRLPKRGPDAAIARVAQALLNGQGADPADCAALVRVVSNPHADRWRESAVSIWAVNRIPLTKQVRRNITTTLIQFADRRQLDSRIEASTDAVAR